MAPRTRRILPCGLAQTLALSLALAPLAPALADGALQCVPYARVVSGIDLRGDALDWWDQADGHYDRGARPRKGAIMAFRPTGPMTLGHLAVVSRILNDREVLIRHANWSSAGAIEEDVLARDVSDEGNWSEVLVWHSPTGQLGVRVNPLYGFIYPDKARLHRFVPERDAASARFAYLTPAPVVPGSDTRQPLVERRLARDVPAAQIPAPPPAARPVEVAAHGEDGFIIEYLDEAPARAGRTAKAQPRERSLADIVSDVRRGAKIS